MVLVTRNKLTSLRWPLGDHRSSCCTCNDTKYGFGNLPGPSRRASEVEKRKGSRWRHMRSDCTLAEQYFHRRGHAKDATIRYVNAPRAAVCHGVTVTDGAFPALSPPSELPMIGSQKSHVLIRHCDPLQLKRPKHLTVFSHPLHTLMTRLFLSSVLLSTSHNTQRQCALRSFSFHPANSDGIPLQQLSPSKLPSSFSSPGLSSALPLTYTSRRPPSAYRPRSMAVHVAPHKAT